MKNLSKLLLTLLLSIGFLFPGCEKDSCDGVVFETYFDIIGMRVTNFSRYDLFDEGRVIAADDTITFEELDKVYIDFNVDYVASTAPQPSWSFSLIPTAYSCTYIPGSDGAKDEGLVSFTITTLHDFDDDHLANSDITDLFEYHGHYLELLDASIPLSQFIAQQSGTIKHEDMVLDLTKAPELSEAFQIKVVMELTNGDYFEANSDPIFIVE